LTGADFMETDFPSLMASLQPAALATAALASPVDGAQKISSHPVLLWNPGQDAIAHRVYFGEVNPPPFLIEQEVDVFQAADLLPGVTYYWRIDEVTPAGVVTGEVWSFTTEDLVSGRVQEWPLNGDLSVRRGDAVLSFAQGAETEVLTSFELSDGDLVPHMEDGPSHYLRIPALSDFRLGLDLALSPRDDFSQMTLIFDILIPCNFGWLPFFNTNVGNTDDSDWFVRADGALGLGILGYSPADTIRSNQWQRVIVSASASQERLAYYVDGQKVFERSVPPFAVQAFLQATLLGGEGPRLRLFNDNNAETSEVLVGALAAFDGSFTDQMAAGLGAASSGGIGLFNERPQIKDLSYQDDGGKVVFTWISIPGARHQVQFSRDLEQWETISEGLVTPDGVGRFERQVGDDEGYYRVLREGF